MVKVYVQFVEKEFDCMNEEELLKYRQESTRIVCAAMLMKDKTVVPGVRHFSPEMRIVLHKMYGNGYHLLVEEHQDQPRRGRGRESLRRVTALAVSLC